MRNRARARTVAQQPIDEIVLWHDPSLSCAHPQRRRRCPPSASSLRKRQRASARVRQEVGDDSPTTNALSGACSAHVSAPPLRLASGPSEREGVPLRQRLTDVSTTGDGAAPAFDVWLASKQLPTTADARGTLSNPERMTTRAGRPRPAQRNAETGAGAGRPRPARRSSSACTRPGGRASPWAQDCWRRGDVTGSL